MQSTFFASSLVAVAMCCAPLTSQAQGAKGAIDDAAIVGIFDAANTWDIGTGGIAATKAKNAEVKAFGAMLARDHQSVQKQGRELAKKLGVTPTPVAKDFALKKDYDVTIKQL